ncbi:hypothetical protein [Candidatus Poriferisodalis sp.]|uniref:tetratricopeptide repeat protein n=1 Tax=Candidatus Poriferisodalis sp. TaxID=3101277 RepID=UPI003C6FBD10
MDELEYDWLAIGSLTYATDFAASALIAGKPERAIATQELLLNAGGTFRTLGQALTKDHRPYDILVNDQPGSIRSLLRSNPRFVLAWVELARIQYSHGHVEAAGKSLRAAVALAPYDRHVLRSQANFYVSIREPDRALHVLTPAASETFDPWLLSAEISVSEVAERKSKLRRKSRERLRAGQWHWGSVSELASELATLEDPSGKSSRARNLLQISLRQPTDNSIAQAVTIAQRDHAQWLIDTLVKHKQDISESAEAAALHSERMGNFEDAVRHARRWQKDQPFSRTAANYGSSIAALGSEDWASSLDFAVKGRRIHPNDASLMNNMAYSLIESGQDLDEAHRLILTAGKSKNMPPEFQAVVTATMGLHAYRTGDPEQGRRMYDQAALIAQQLKKHRTEALALSLHARETDDQSAAKKMLERADKLIDSRDKLSLHVYQRSTNLIKR